MSELDVIKLLCWPGATLSLIAAAYTGWPVLRAEGPRPFHLVLFILSCGTALGALALLAIFYDLTENLSRVSVWFLVLKPTLVGGALLWLGWAARRKY